MKVNLILLHCLFMSIQVFSQNDFPKKYRAGFIGIGSRTLNTDPGTIILSYTDESPSMDNLESIVSVEDKYSKLGIQFGYEWGRYRGLSHAILFDIEAEKNPGGQISYSLGYNFPFKVGNGALLLRPAFFVGFGNYGFDLGDLQNNAGYIEINGNQYYDRKLDVKLSSQTGVYGPEMDVMWMFAEYFNAFINIHYNLGGRNSRPEIRFIPAATSSADNTSSETSIDLDHENLSITYNGDELTSLPYSISGIRFTVGVSFVWNRD